MQVTLGVLSKNENRYEEIIDIMEHLLQYVLSIHKTATVEVAGQSVITHTQSFLVGTS